MFTPNLNLELPVIGVSTGPEWGSAINQNLEVIDTHNHTPGRGRPIPIEAVEFSGNLNLNSQNINNSRTIRFNNSLSAIPATGDDQRALYVKDGELFFNDQSGNEVRMTLSGAVDVAATGAIQALTAPASAVYDGVEGLFTFSQNTDFRADMAIGSLFLADPLVQNSKTITLKTPASASIAVPFDITLPGQVAPGNNSVLIGDVNAMLQFSPILVPGSAPTENNTIVKADQSGQIGYTPLKAPTSTPASNNTIVRASSSGDLSFTSRSAFISDIANDVIEEYDRPTGISVGVRGYARRNTQGGVTFSPVEETIIDANITLSTTGRPVHVGFFGGGRVQGSLNAGSISEQVRIQIRIKRNGTTIYFADARGSDDSVVEPAVPFSSFHTIDEVGSGTHNYTATIDFSISGGSSFQGLWSASTFAAYEI